ncbi:MAG: hypothetical protein U9P63_00475 [Patescibacteria group bacterium]|nr:hypothetical protein [Patescibacteria group bacterium]
MKDFIFIVIIALILVFWYFAPARVQERVGNGGIYYSEDGGETWEQMAIKENRFLITSLDILSMAVHPGNSDVLYLGAKKGGLYKSYSRGKYWHQITGEEKNLFDDADIYDIAIDNKDADKIYLAVYQNKRGRIFRSEDGGERWEEVYAVLEKQQIISQIVIDSYDSSVVYAGTTEGGFLKSVDCCKSWQAVKWFDGAVSKIAINPKDTRVVYVGLADGGVYKTRDKGITWHSLEDNLEEFDKNRAISAAGVDPKNPNTVYLGSLYGLLVSGDGGLNWQAVKTVMPSESKSVLSLNLGLGEVSQLIYGADSIVYRSSDGGKNWVVSQLPADKKIKEIVIDPQNPNLIYAGVGE